MKSFEYTIKDPLGLHARPAGLLVKTAQGTGSRVSIEKNGKSVLADRLLSLMGMGVRMGDVVKVTVDGGDEDATLDIMREFFEKHL